MKKLRESLGMTHEQLAIKSGLSIQLVRLYEYEPVRRNNAKLISLIKLAKALNCKVSDLIEDKEMKSDFENLK
jgi:transcriptional regulator with XRE-family HTH domain